MRVLILARLIHFLKKEFFLQTKKEKREGTVGGYKTWEN